MKKSIASLGCLALLTLVACSATFNWREVRFEAEQFLALFPAKAQRQQQTVRFENIDYPMTMAAAKAGEILFAVGTIPFAEKDVSSLAMVDWMKTNTVKIFPHHEIPQTITAEIKTVGLPSQKLLAQDYHLKGMGPDGVYRIYWVRWVVRKHATDPSFIYQLSAIQSFKNEPKIDVFQRTTEQFETFMSGFRPY